MKKKWYSEDRLQAIENWKNLKYGMFIHFGLYSLCGGMWDGKNVEIGYSEQILSHGPVPYCDYENLMNEFTIEKFNADEIAQLAVDSGMKYIVITTKHHDGFCLFDTKTTDYSTMHAACHRDIVKELSEACARHGLKLGLYFSWIDWHCPDALPTSRHNSDRIPPKHMEYNIAQLTELLSNYGPICELWMDMGYPTPEQSKQVKDLALRLQPQIMVNGRVWNSQGDFLTMGDNQFPTCELDLPWQTPATVYHETWGYRAWQERTDFDEKVKSISEAMVGVFNGGGNYLLNIGPMGDGSLVPFECDILRTVGKEVKRMCNFERHPVDTEELTEVNADSFVLQNGKKHYSYSGSEYYTFKPIMTGLSYKIELPEDGEYVLSYELDEPLAKETKIIVETDDDTLGVPLKQKVQSLGIYSHLKLHKGVNRILVASFGSPMERDEFELENIKLVFNKR